MSIHLAFANIHFFLRQNGTSNGSWFSREKWNVQKWHKEKMNEKCKFSCVISWQCHISHVQWVERSIVELFRIWMARIKCVTIPLGKFLMAGWSPPKIKWLHNNFFLGLSKSYKHHQINFVRTNWNCQQHWKCMVHSNATYSNYSVS